MTRPASLPAAAHGAERGAVAIEFALLAPLLLAILVGAVEFGDVALADRRAAGAADMVARLAAREGSISADDLDALGAIASAVVRHGRARQLGLHVVGIRIDGEGVAQAQWRKIWGGVPPPPLPQASRWPGEGTSLVSVRLVYVASPRLAVFTDPHAPRQAIATQLIDAAAEP
jgi:Flp pilus assembly protein TadG